MKILLFVTTIKHFIIVSYISECKCVKTMWGCEQKTYKDCVKNTYIDFLFLWILNEHQQNWEC